MPISNSTATLLAPRLPEAVLDFPALFVFVEPDEENGVVKGLWSVFIAKDREVGDVEKSSLR